MNAQAYALDDFVLFQDLSSEELLALDDYLGIMELPSGEVVFSEGDRGEFVCFVIDVELEVLKKPISGGENLLATLAKGDAIGEMALVDHMPRSATVRATTPATLTVLSKVEFEALLEKAPATGIRILQHIAHGLSVNLRRTSNRLTDCMELDCKER